MSQMSSSVDPVLAFSTLACPEWSPQEVVRRAAAMGFDAVEWRGGPSGHLNAGSSPPLIADLRRLMRDHGIRPLALTTYGSLVAEGPSDRIREAVALRAELDIAADIGADFIRVFVGIPDRSTPKAELRHRAVDALRAAAEHAAEVGVDIAVEPHDLHGRGSDIRPILEGVAHPRVGVIWEVAGAWTAGEDPADVLSFLGPWVRYVQLRDARLESATWRSCRFGDGEVPLARALSGYQARGMVAPLSIEWVRAWEPELDPAEVALPAALRYVRLQLARARDASARDEA